MVITKLQGGLGNQMFQYAAAAGQAAKGHVYLDTSFLKKHTTSNDTFTARDFELALFPNLETKLVSKLLIRILQNKKRAFRLLKKGILPNLKIVTDADTGFLNSYKHARYKTLYLDGYFQNEYYFKHIRQRLQKTFEFPQITGSTLEWWKKIQNCNDSVSVHVRRGDYLKPQVHSFHGVLPLSYYQKAKDIADSKLNSPKYFIFSDDLIWCRENLCMFGSGAEFIESQDAAVWEDMCLMSQCKHHIIANSSYSWWGAWLNNNKDKIVIAPERWFAHEHTNIVPKEWISI